MRLRRPLEKSLEACLNNEMNVQSTVSSMPVITYSVTGSSLLQCVCACVTIAAFYKIMKDKI